MALPGQCTIEQGDLLVKVLNLISKKEMTEAEIMESIEKLSTEFWSLSPGSVYPILKDLEKEGFLKSREEMNKKY